MQCKKIMSQDVQWVAPSETVAYAAKLMAFHNVGFLPVCSVDGKPLGVITDRDIALRVVGKDRQPTQTQVEDVMTTPIHTVTSDCSLEQAGEVMTKASVSRLIVLDEAGFLVGLIGTGDLIVRGPGRTALEIARGIYARETSSRSTGNPRPAETPTPEFFHGRRNAHSDTEGSGPENPARLEAENVNRGGTNDLKEFPS